MAPNEKQNHFIFLTPMKANKSSFFSTSSKFSLRWEDEIDVTTPGFVFLVGAGKYIQIAEGITSFQPQGLTIRNTTQYYYFVLNKHLTEKIGTNKQPG